jgi:two-component system, sensor histidine kinase and response regulator
MSDQDRNKEELLKELQRLRLENDALKLGQKAWVDGANLENGSQNLLHGGFWETKDYVDLAVSTSPDAALITRLSDGVVVNLNLGFTKLTGFTPEDVIGKSTVEIQLWKNPSERQLMTENLQENGFIDNFEAEFLRKDGSALIGLMSAKVFRVNEISYIISLTRNITDRKMAEEALKENRNFLNVLLDAIPVPVFYKDNQGRYLGFNPAFERFFGKTKDELIGKSVFDISEYEFAKIYHEKDQELFDNIGVQHYEGKVKNTHDDIRDVVFNKASLVDIHGNITGLVGAILDITDRKRAEEALKLSEKKFRMFADNVSDVIWQMDSETRMFNYMSPSVERLTGYKVEEVLQNPFDWILTPKSQEFLIRVIPILRARYQQGENETFVMELEHPCINGNTVWTETTTRYLIDEKTGRLMVFGSARDITKRKKAEREIVVKNEELQKLNAQKDKFFSIIAHDLKSPFNSIIGFSELLITQVGEKDYEGIENYANIILQSSERAMGLLSNLMEWARSQTGRLEFKPDNVDLVDLVSQINILFNDIARQKSITIEMNLPQKYSVCCDKEMIATVIRNLISNAIKFSMPGGKITVTLTESENECLVSVQDNGVGIPKDRIDKLFRIDESYSTEGTQQEQGTGLGLILCKEFVEKHGGTISVKSEKGKGSDFVFTIPVREKL